MVDIGTHFSFCEEHLALATRHLYEVGTKLLFPKYDQSQDRILVRVIY